MLTDHDIILLAAYLGGSVVIGLIVRKWIVPMLSRLTSRTKWKSDDIIINSVKNWVIFWFFLGGLSIVLPLIHISDAYKNTIQKIVEVCVVFSLTWVTARIISQLVALQTGMHGAALRSTSIASNIVKIIIYSIGLLFLLQSLGVSITPLLTALGVGGLAVALALQGTLSNLFSGIQIIASGKIKTNDYVQLASGEEGYVQDISWRSATIKALPNHIIIIPNSKLAEAIVRNYSLPENEIAVLLDVGVSYSSDLDKVEKITIDVAIETLKEVQGGVPEFTPFIRYGNFNDSSINFTVILRAKEFTDQYLIKHEFIKRLHKRYQQESIEIPFPIRTVYLKHDEKKE